MRSTFVAKVLSVVVFGTSSLAFIGSAPAHAVDLVVVEKAKRQMTLFDQGKKIKQYRIAMGDSPKGHKVREGDEKTPQGRYILDYKKPDSAYHRSIHISYPNEADKLRAKALGVPVGGMIMIHGEKPNSGMSPEQLQSKDWTNGCIALTNKEMDEVWALVEAGTPIEIWP